jgi:hypothetical protein
VEKAINKMWGKIKETLKKKLAGEDIGEMPAESQMSATQYQQEPYYAEQSFKEKKRNNNSAFGSISLTIGVVMTLLLVIGIASNFSSGSFYFVSYGAFMIFPFIGFIYGIVGTSKDRNKAMGIIGLIIDVIFFIGVLVLFL